MGDREWLTPEWELTGREYREARAALEAKEARLRAADKRDGGHRLRDHENEQSRLLQARISTHRAQNGGCVLMLVLLLAVPVIAFVALRLA